MSNFQKKLQETIDSAFKPNFNNTNKRINIHSYNRLNNDVNNIEVRDINQTTLKQIKQNIYKSKVSNTGIYSPKSNKSGADHFLSEKRNNILYK